MVETVKLILLSFISSTGLAIVFGIDQKYVLRAGLSGALTRCVYLLLMQFTQERLIYILLSTMVTALYAEIMAAREKMPSTVFLYPAIIPLLPGSLLYNTLVNFMTRNMDAMYANALDCILTLIGMSVGFVLVSTFVYYKRLYFLGRDFVGSLIRRPVRRR